MNEAQHAKWANLLTDHEKDNDSFTAAALDTKGWGYCEIACVLQNLPANMAALKVQESDDDSTYADVTGLVVGTSTDIDGNTSALPLAASDDDTIRLFQIDLRARKRYLKLIATAGDGSGTASELTAVARLSRGEVVPITGSGMGSDGCLRV